MALYISTVVTLYVRQRELIYFPDHKTVYSSRSVTVLTKDHLEIRGLFIPPKGEHKTVIVMFHSNAGHHGLHLYKGSPYVRKGYGFFLAGYRGYGGNPGKPSEEGLYKDARAYMEYLIHEQHVAPEHIILYGETLGTSVAVQMSTEYNVAGLVLERPFDSVVGLANHHFPYVPFTQYFIKDPYRNDLKAKDIRAKKVLLIVAGKDWVVPRENSAHLYGLINKPKKFSVLEDARFYSIYDFHPDEIVSDFMGL